MRRDADKAAPDDGSGDVAPAGRAAGTEVGAEAENEDADLCRTDVAPARVDLRSVAQLHEVERKLQSARFGVAAMNWFLMPAMAATLAVSIGHALSSESGGLADAVPFVLLFAVTGAVVLQSWRMMQTRVAELEFEKADLGEIVGSAGEVVERRP